LAGIGEYMAILPLIIDNDPLLRKISLPVAKVDKAVRKLIANMQMTMRKHHGMGLAAVQVGQLLRVIVLEYEPVAKERKTERVPFVALINPVIYWHSQEEWEMAEGCLSLPCTRGPVVRPEAIKVRALSDQGKILDFFANGIKARIIQHEVDHCDGKLFTDYVPEGLIEKEEPEYRGKK